MLSNFWPTQTSLNTSPSSQPEWKTSGLHLIRLNMALVTYGTFIYLNHAHCCDLYMPMFIWVHMMCGGLCEWIYPCCDDMAYNFCEVYSTLIVHRSTTEKNPNDQTWTYYKTRSLKLSRLSRPQTISLKNQVYLTIYDVFKQKCWSLIYIFAINIHFLTGRRRGR